MIRFFDAVSIGLIVCCLILQILNYNGNVGAVLGWVCALSAQLNVIYLNSKLKG